MFGHRYFGSRYFGPRYWGDGGNLAPVVVTARQTPAGRAARRRRREEYEVEYRDHIYRFPTPDEAVAFLQSIQPREIREAKAQARRDATRILATGRLAPIDRKDYIARFIAPSASFSLIGERFLNEIEKAYDHALMDAVAREAEDDEDIAILMELGFL